MSTAAAAKAAPTPAASTPAPVQAPVAPDAKTRRQVQPRKLTPERVLPEGQHTQPQEAMLPSGWDFEDVLKPDFWASWAHRLDSAAQASSKSAVGTKIRILTEDDAFDAVVRVIGLRKNAFGVADGLHVVCIGPCYDPETDQCYPVDAKTGKRWTGRKPKAV